RIETVLTASDFEGMMPGYNSRRTSIINLLQLLAYESKAFERCIRLLIQVADYEEESNDNNSVRNQIIQFFQAYLSGTHASLSQRISIMNEYLTSGVARRRSLGFRMFSTALEAHWTCFGMNEFGARPRDNGFNPSQDELSEWRKAFIDIAVKLGTSRDPNLESSVRKVLANAFRDMWGEEAMRIVLVDAAYKLHAHHPWGEGWIAIRSTIYLDHIKLEGESDVEPLPDNLAALERALRPQGLVPKIMIYVLSSELDSCVQETDFENSDTDVFQESENQLEARAFRLGEAFAASEYGLNELCPKLFSNDWLPYRISFGRGLARGAHDLQVGWLQLVEQLEQQPETCRDFAVFGGFIGEVEFINPPLAEEMLEYCAQHPDLRRVLVGLHSQRKFTETDLNRCMVLLDDVDIPLSMYGPILWQDKYAHLPRERILDLALQLLSKPNGDDVVVHALSIRLRGKERDRDVLGTDLRRIGLRAAIQIITREHHNYSGSVGYRMDLVIQAALRFDGNEAEKLEWLDTIFAVVEKHHGYIHAFNRAINTTAGLMPEAFLNRILEGTEEQQRRRLFFIHHSGLRQSPLSKIDMDVLIEWCRTKNDPYVWGIVAVGVSLWTEGEDLGGLTMSASSIRLLEASPEPEIVLEAFAKRACSGRGANMMRPKADAIRKLVQHERADIAAAAQLASAKLTEWIKDEQEREQREDMDHEQRFE
ncbi:TPA: hypothetical protein P2M23_003219, partial [Aeromonas salmonicida]|nr:hypothetical protein [Aeromonas salmonicida]ELI6444776.1 hypothetical protein [Aeromonas salmonicida subsp. salmonicida]EKP0265878.1 hypothetical protein [Aeromonas salmonicida]EKP0270257.1 hypothetical protein [Aeromonas salmonicida]EKP0287851.1 hypothetical protein [Aeromonas salmonicida]